MARRRGESRPAERAWDGPTFVTDLLQLSHESLAPDVQALPRPRRRAAPTPGRAHRNSIGQRYFQAARGARARAAGRRPDGAATVPILRSNRSQASPKTHRGCVAMRLAVFTSIWPCRVTSYFARDMRALIEAGIELDIFAIYPYDPHLWEDVPQSLSEQGLPRAPVHPIGLGAGPAGRRPRRAPHPSPVPPRHGS